MSTESVTARSAQPGEVSSSPTPLGHPEIAKTPPENSPILIEELFGRLPEGYTLLDIADSVTNISKLRDYWTKKKGKTVNIRPDSDISILIQGINTQEPVDAVTTLDQLQKITGKEEKIAVLTAISNRLKPGGMLLITVPVSSAMEKLSESDESKEYDRIVKESGFTTVITFINKTNTKTPNNFTYEIIAQKPLGQQHAAT